MDTIDINHLESLKEKIETLNQLHQIEILKIFSKNLCKLNENKNGIFINMSFVPNEVIQEVDKYMGYIKEQSETFDTAEYQKEEFKNIILENEPTDNIISYNSVK